MKVIIAGSRNFNSYNLLKEHCDRILKSYENEDFEIISGGANGTDKLGEKYAEELSYPVKVFMADWNRFEKAAGYIRNEQMAKYAKENGILIAFWDSVSKGTSHMIDIAGRYGLPVHIVYFAGPIDKNAKLFYAG